MNKLNTLKACFGNYLRAGRTKLRGRVAFSLLELVVSMGLLSLIMVPVIGLLGTSYKVYTAGNERLDGDYARSVALDASVRLVRGAIAADTSQQTALEVRFPDGQLGRLELIRGDLIWSDAKTNQLVASGLSQARFSTISAAKAPTSAGFLLQIEYATQPGTSPMVVWSRTQIWLRPAI